MKKRVRKRLLSKRNSRKARQRKIDKGDMDATLFKDALYVALREHPYFQERLHGDVSSNVKLMGQELTALVRDEETGALYQVDIDAKPMDVSIDDREWEMSGGGEDQAKGRYRNLILSQIAKLRSQEETEREGVPVKISINLPGAGYIKITNRETGEREKERHRDPDVYLPLLLDPEGAGSAIDKSTLRSFEGVVDYMLANTNPLFEKSLDEFSDYIARYPEEDNQVALDYINTARGNMMNEILAEINLIKTIRRLLNEEASGQQRASLTGFNPIEKHFFDKNVSFGDGNGEVSVALSLLGTSWPLRYRTIAVNNVYRAKGSGIKGTIFGPPPGQGNKQALIGGPGKTV